MKKLNKGFSGVEVVIAVAALALLGFIGYTVYSNHINRDNTVESSIAEDVPTTDQVPEVETTKDIKAAEKFLNDINLDDDTDLDELNDQLNNF